MKITFLGAAETVTGSRFLLEYHNKKILIDCGLFQGTKELRTINWNSVTDAHKIDFVLLSHAHIDHSGYLPKLYRDGFRGPIYSTRETAALCEILLPDSGRLQEEDAYFANKTKHSHHNPALPLYTESDAQIVLKNFRSKPLNEWHEIIPGLSFRFLRAGHILGSCIIQLSCANNLTQTLITFSGDLGNHRSLILKDPQTVTETDVLILESTYGDRVQPRTNVSDEIAKIINTVIARRGTLIIPAFALGRSQEIIYIIKKLEIAGVIPIVPVYLDSPMAEKITEVYTKLDSDIKSELNENYASLFTTNRFRMVAKSDESMALCSDTSPKIVISAAGMLTGGRILHHLKAQLPKKENGVLFIGYQAEGTKGLLLKNGIRNLRIHHQVVDVEAEIFSMDSLSAHADSNDLVQWVNNITSKPSSTYLVHGEKNALNTLKYRLEHECQLSHVIIPKREEQFSF